jgi:hypothetical protein
MMLMGSFLKSAGECLFGHETNVKLIIVCLKEMFWKNI